VNIVTYGELSADLIQWATQNIIGLQEPQLPETIVLTPFHIDRFFSEFLTVVEAENLVSEEIKSGYLVKSKDEQILFCRTGMGASVFADITNVLCNCQNTKTLLFVGTAGGISDEVQPTDLNIPPSCLRLDKVLEILLPLDAPADVDKELANQIQSNLKAAVAELEVNVHSQLHATVPFITCETEVFLRGLEKQGVWTIDMELSVLYALANHYNLRSAGIILVEDLPLHGLPFWKCQDINMELKQQVQTKVLQSILRTFFEKSI
jgi:purine-nucleoside phosphorylase